MRNRAVGQFETRFFHDAAFLRSLKRWARRRLETWSPGTSLRVWIPGCGGGEDAYSVAICLLEAFGSRWREIPLCIFFTDSDAEIHSRAGRFPSQAAKGIARKKFDRFFIRESGGIRVRPFVRDACRFLKHDPAQSPPFHRLDLIACREVSAALPPPARRDALKIFHSALAPAGVLLDRTAGAADVPEFFKRDGRAGFYVARNVAASRPGPNGAGSPIVGARLRESEERFRILFARSEDAILLRDTETDRILQANEAARTLFGWSLPELLGMRGKDLLAVQKSVRRAGAERRSAERLRLPHYRRKNGTLFPVDVNASFLMLDGRPCELWTLRDAAPRLRASSGRSRAEAQESFVGDVVHELRSPIAVIRGFVETLQNGVRGKRDRAAFLSFIENHAVRMAGLVDQLLDLSAADAAKRGANPVPVLLSEAVWAVAAAFVPAAKRRVVALKIDIPAGLAVRADPADLPHVFGNLLDNAIKFTPRGGEVFISARAEGGEAILSVRDTGAGLAPEDLERIFERFYRGARAKNTKGTGLGLAIVRGIVKANRGRVHAENHPSGGAVFHVALPLAQESTR